MVILRIGFSLLLGGIFLFSAVPKLRRPRGFVLTVLEYRVLPSRLSYFYGWLLPSVELFIALLLLSGVAIRLAGALTALLLLSFIIAVSINLARGRSLDCGCFGKKAKRKIGKGLLLQDGFLLAAAITLSFLAPTWMNLESWSAFRLAGLTDSMLPLLLLVGLALVAGALSRWGGHIGIHIRKGGVELQR